MVDAAENTYTRIAFDTIIIINFFVSSTRFVRVHFMRRASVRNGNLCIFPSTFLRSHFICFITAEIEREKQKTQRKYDNAIKITNQWEVDKWGSKNLHTNWQFLFVVRFIFDFLFAHRVRNENTPLNSFVWKFYDFRDVESAIWKENCRNFLLFNHMSISTEYARFN